MNLECKTDEEKKQAEKDLFNAANQDIIPDQLKGVTAEEMFDKVQQQMEEIRKEEEFKAPLISARVPFILLLSEYESSPNFTQKINNLKNTYSIYRALRRDGACFYRAYMFRILERFLTCELTNDLKSLEQKLRNAEQFMNNNGFEKIVTEDMAELVIRTLDSCIKRTIDLAGLEAIFTNKDESNYIVMFVRFLTSAYLQQNKESYCFYITEGLTIEQFCRMNVETLDSEADHVQIIAVFNYFEIPQRVIYLDNTPGGNTHDMILPEGYTGDIWMKLLYRPGHYDLIYLK